MPSGNRVYSPSPPEQFASISQLAAAFQLVTPVVDDADAAWIICQDAALAPPGTSMADVLSSDTLKVLLADRSSETIQEQVVRLALTSQQLRSIAEQLSGTLLGASYGSALALQLIELRDSLGLQAADCLRLITAVWPQVMFAGRWAQWYVHLKSLSNETALALSCHATLDLLNWLSICARWLGDFENAQIWIEQALQLASRKHAPERYAHFTLASGTLQRLRGRLLSAESTVKYARSQFDRLADPLGVQRCCIEMAQLALDDDKPQQALEHLVGIAESPQTRALRAEACLALGDYEQAATLLLDITAVSKPNAGRVYALLGKTHLQAGRLEAASAAVTRATDILQTTDDILGYARALTLQGEILLETGDPVAAIEALEQACRSRSELREDPGHRLTLRLLLKAYPVLIEQALEQNQLLEAQRYTTRLIEHSHTLEQLPPQ